MSAKRWRKSKIALAVLAVVTIGFFSVFNTSTRYGRWLYWQDIDLGDIDRFAFRIVENNPEAVSSFATNRASGSIRQVIFDFRIRDETLVEFAASHESTALIIIYDNEVLLEEYFQGNQRDSLQSGISCTKSVVSLLVGIAIDEGLIGSIDDSISEYVDGLRPEFSEVTIRQLLTMTSGIGDTDEKLFDVVPAPWSDEVSGYYDPNLRQLAKSFSLDHKPGERFEYHDFNPILIGMLLENATGKSLSDYLGEKIWQPAGMQFPAKWSLDSRRHGFEMPATGLHGRAIDFARLGAKLIDQNQTIVSRAWLQQSVLDQHAGQLVKESYAASADRADSKGAKELADHVRGLRYGFYWWGIEREGRYDYYANGHFGQFIYISPDARLVVVRNGTGHGGLNDWYFGNYFFNLASKVIAADRQNTWE
ncbi:MAG: serine hydrolase [Woeseia sp.]|nr:serine hydrolase [Woeseia sp.]